MKCVWLLCVAVVCVLSGGQREGVKDYPAPLFIWAENDRYLRGGRQWLSESVSNSDVLAYITALTTREEGAMRQEAGTLFPTQAAPHNPEVVVVFLEPGLLFGRTDHYGGSRFASSHLEFKKLKRLIEGSYSSIVAPYTYDSSLSLLSLSNEDHENNLMLTWSDMIGDYVSRCGEKCYLYVDVEGDVAMSVWETLLFSNTNIVKVRGEEYFEDNAAVFTNGVSDLIVVHLTNDAVEADRKVSRVMESISRHTKSYVALFTADDLYVPTQSTLALRETPEKMEWVERKSDASPMPSPPPTPSPSSTPSPPPGPFRYDSRWPEFVWEFLLSFLLVVIILSFGVCCLCGIDTPRRFDNPKEKNL